MPTHYQTKRPDDDIRTQAEQAERAYLTQLVRRYDAVRLTPGVERDLAAFLLGDALRRSGPFRCDGFVWQWSKTERSIVRHIAVATSHPRGAREKERAT